MSNRKTKTYKAVFEYIEKNVFKLKPTEIITDWEAGMRNALRFCYPSAILRGCWYHYCAAIRKKFLKLGLHFLLVSDYNARFIKQQIMSLPLLPPENFETGYAHIKNMAKEFDFYEKLIPFFTYFDDYWLKQVHLCFIFTQRFLLTSRVCVQ